MRFSVRVTCVILTIAALTGCSRSAAFFSEQNARAHVAMLAGTIGSRPVGTPENARARAYIIDQLKLYGYEVRVQETDARRSDLGLTARVANIIAVLPGTRQEAVGLLSHYDSVPDAPGAGDDAFGVAVSLEAARLIAGRDRTWTTMVLVTDAEEMGLMGAAALVHDPEVNGRLRAYLNLEASGSAGPAMLFQTGPGNHWLVRPWARRAPNPRGGSYAIEIYNRLPNDTDFSILRTREIPGLNFALVGDSYAYHTARDTPDRLSSDALRTTGENVIATLDALQQTDITQRSPREATYFDVAGWRAVSYSAAFDWFTTGAAALLALIAWLRLTRFVVRSEGLGRWLLGFAGSILAAIAVVTAMVAATWILRMAREAYHPWYARPERLFLMLVAIGLAAAWFLRRLSRWAAARVHGLRHPAVTWTYTLPLWFVLAVAMSWLAPRAAYMWTLPLMSAGLVLSIVPVRRDLFVRIGSLVIFAIAGSLWLRDSLELLRYIVAVFGRLPLVTPVYVYAALLTAVGAMVAPPLLAATSSVARYSYPRVGSTLALLAVAITVPLAYLAPAYTYEQPLRRDARVLQEPGAAESLWLVGSVEPGLDIDDAAPGSWTPGNAERSASVPWGGLRGPFIFSGTGPPIGEAPATIRTFELNDVAGGIELAISVVPREPGVRVTFHLPQDAAPARSSIPGVMNRGRWSATYAAPPPEGIAFRASFTGITAERLRETRVAVTSARLPGGDGWQRLPRWLPQDRMVWTLRATWVLSPPALLEPVPPLR